MTRVLTHMIVSFFLFDVGISSPSRYFPEFITSGKIESLQKTSVFIQTSNDEGTDKCRNDYCECETEESALNSFKTITISYPYHCKLFPEFNSRPMIFPNHGVFHPPAKFSFTVVWFYVFEYYRGFLSNMHHV
jgi:hypothetical protein